MTCDDCGLTSVAVAGPVCLRHARPTPATWRLTRTRADGARLVVEVCDQCRRELSQDARQARDFLVLAEPIAVGG